jgi:NADPH-dependent 2,4-dienoyl-CoA reductase/sulfur reductase-like enzyme
VSRISGNIVVAGGGLAAARTIQQLRRRGHEGKITLVGAESHLPYDRPPLSKALLAGRRDTTSLPFDPEALGVDTLLGTEAEGLELEPHILHTSQGPVSFEQLVVATGSAPVRLPGTGLQMTLRTIEDALALRSRLTDGARVAVIGASWIGAEVACAALAKGCSVTCVEGSLSPLSQALGTEAGRRFLPWWQDIDLRLNATVESIEDHGIRLVGGGYVPADVVVTGIGVRPASSWLDSSGLDVDRGVVVDEYLRTTHSDVFALGDVAARWSRRYGKIVRIQHWDAANMAGAAVAANILADADGGHVLHDPVPYFWSDQFGHKIQYVGHHAEGDELIWREADAAPGISGAWHDGAGRMTAVLTVDRPKESALAQQLL